MNTKNKIFFFFLLSAFLLSAKDITFKHLTVDNGLSQISVMAIYVDERGFVWLGTREGLNCYNGNEIISYNYDKRKSEDLICNNILQITGNRSGDIYILCTEGLTKYNYVTEIFSTIMENKEIKNIQYKNGLYIAHKNEILQYNENTKDFSVFYSLPGESIITSFLITEKALWIGTGSAGVFVLKNQALSHVVKTGEVTSIYEDSKKDIWIGTWENGCVWITNNEIINFRHKAGEMNSIASDFVRAFCEDNNETIWIGTFNGLCSFNKHERKFTTFNNSEEKIGSLTDLSIWSITKDNQGTIWLGTYYGGVNYFNPKYEIYTLIRASSVEEQGLSYPIVGKIVEDSQKNLWICTEGGGLNFYNTQTRKFKWYSSTKKTIDISKDNVKAFYFDEEKQLVWIGLHLGGLNKINLKTQQVTHYNFDPDDPTSIPSNVVLDILPYQNELLVATNNGVCLFSPSTGKAQRLFAGSGYETKFVRDMHFDRNGKLWMAAMGEGVFAYDFETNKLKKYSHRHEETNSLSDNNVYSIYIDTQGNVWICTASGINLLNPASGSVKLYNSQNGLMHDCVYEIRELSPGLMLLLTNQGVAKFDVAKEQFYNFNIVNSLPVKSLNEGALCITSDGKILAGSVEGLLMFNKEDLDSRSLPYNIQFTNLWVNGDKVEINDEKDILHRSLSYTPFFKLKSKYHTFTIEYSTSNYVPENASKVMYQLEGFSDSWIDTQNQRRITFTNLHPGKYTLRLKALDFNEDIISSQTISMQVLPHWYKSNIAYLIYFVLFLCTIYIIAKVNNRRIRIKEKLKYEQKRLEDAEKLNTSKLQFYTNVSHELRTPLTLIIGELEILLQSGGVVSKSKRKLLTIYNNAKLLYDLVCELLDFRKQEQGFMKLSVNKHNFTDFIKEIFLLFKEYANDKNIDFRLETSGETVELWYDAKLIQKVVNNLLSNAFKYVGEEGKIIVKLEKLEKEAMLSIADNGCGISKEEQERIFDSFYQVGDAAQTVGTGLGLAFSKAIVKAHHGTICVKSEIDKGATFIIKLPLGNKQFEQEQFENNDIKPYYDKISGEEEKTLPKLDKEKHYKMLIVEDNLSLLEMLCDLLSPYYVIETAVNGEEAWEKVGDNPPDIIISDVLMPKMSGTEFCKLVKGDISTCHIPVVLLTAQADITHNIEGLRIGADDYVTKPFEPALLISKANSLINNRILLQEKFSKEPHIRPQMLAFNSIDKKIMSDATKILESNISNPEFDIEVFASEMNMSRTVLFSKIKAITGQTPNDLITTFRLKQAAFLLRNNPEMNITEISESVGFGSLRYFCKCFKEKYNQTPTAFRKQKEEPF